MDTPGKDSYELRKAGAAPMLICSSMRTVITIENEIEAEPMLDTILNHIPADTVDMVLVEGFKKWPFNKIELHRELTGKLANPYSIRMIQISLRYNTQPLTNTELPQLDINDINAVADFVMKYAQHYCAT